jgi:microcin C transport system permease protein
MGFSPLTQRRWQKFKGIRRAYYSLIILIVIYILSLGAELIANDKPIFVWYQGHPYFPCAQFYSGKTFGGSNITIADYKALNHSPNFTKAKGNFMIFPLLPYGPNESLFNIPGYPPNPPTLRNLMGTDDRGRDILTRLIYGYRVSFTFAIVITLLSMGVGIFFGGIQGYYGGKFDITMQRFIEILSSLPFLYVVIIIGSSLGTSMMTLLLCFLVFDWIGISFYLRSEFFKLRQVQFVEAARSLGVSDLKIMFRHILPNSLTPIITFLPFDLIGAIFALSSLDYLGFGLPAPTPSWGELVRQGMENLTSYWLSIFPILTLFIVLLLIAFVGEGIREAFDPKEYARMES